MSPSKTRLTKPGHRPLSRDSSGRDPLSGDLFVVESRDRRRAKVTTTLYLFLRKILIQSHDKQPGA